MATIAAGPPGLTTARATALAGVAKALADPTRLQIVDALREATPGTLCQCELVPRFPMSQPALARHLKVLVEAGVIASERRGAWVHYVVPTDSRIEELTSWLS